MWRLQTPGKKFNVESGTALWMLQPRYSSTIELRTIVQNHERAMYTNLVIGEIDFNLFDSLSFEFSENALHRIRAALASHFNLKFMNLERNPSLKWVTLDASFTISESF